ncbi:unnamed protein product [Rotaria sp. Silwood2]|nr:unnamed protein product [Rotaria sp. Silwood2]
MSNIIKLTLSIRDTFDSQFCHGPTMELILTEYLPYLRQFDYTMTYRINDELLIEDFVRWPMNVTHYFNENSKWIHIYSLPWPSNKNDQRRLPIVENGYKTLIGSDIKHLNITKSDELIQLESYFHRVSIGSIRSIVQTYIRHLTVERRLFDEQELFSLAHQYPNVKYLHLLFPLNHSLFLRCFQVLFSMDGNSGKKLRF